MIDWIRCWRAPRWAPRFVRAWFPGCWTQEEIDQIWARAEAMTRTIAQHADWVKDMREPGEAFCSDCPDHEACASGYPCEFVKFTDKHSRRRDDDG